MNTHAYQMELSLSRVRVRQALLVSGAFHVVLLIFLLLYKPPVKVDLGAVEIDWLNPAPPVVEPIRTEPVRERKREKPEARTEEAVRTEQKEERFERPEPEAFVAPPDPKPLARSDKLSSRLTGMREPVSARKPLSVSKAEPTSLLKSMAAPSGPAPTATKTVKLNHDAKPSRPALALNTQQKGKMRAKIAPVSVSREVKVEAARTDQADADLKRTLDGATLAGPAAGREVLHHELPVYPGWAMQEATEATVTIYFVVLPDGRVKDTVQIQKTGGYADFDRNASAAIKLWRFKPLPQGQNNEQWGTINFRFRLRDAGR